MQRRRWDSKTKVLIVMQGLKGKPVAEICTEHQIKSSQYYQWRDEFFSKAHRVFEEAQATQREQRLLRENQKLKGLVGELTMELKKIEDEGFV